MYKALLLKFKFNDFTALKSDKSWPTLSWKVKLNAGLVKGCYIYVTSFHISYQYAANFVLWFYYKAELKINRNLQLNYASLTSIANPWITHLQSSTAHSIRAMILLY